MSSDRRRPREFRTLWKKPHGNRCNIGSIFHLWSVKFVIEAAPLLHFFLTVLHFYTRNACSFTRVEACTEKWNQWKVIGLHASVNKQHPKYVKMNMFSLCIMFIQLLYQICYVSSTDKRMSNRPVNTIHWINVAGPTLKKIDLMYRVCRAVINWLNHQNYYD